LDPKKTCAPNTITVSNRALDEKGRVVVNAIVRKVGSSIMVLPPEENVVDDLLTVISHSTRLRAASDATVFFDTEGFSMVELPFGSDVMLQWGLGDNPTFHQLRWTDRRNIRVDDKVFKRWVDRLAPFPRPIPLSQVNPKDLRRSAWTPRDPIELEMESELEAYL
jgi:hypothetical protein